MSSRREEIENDPVMDDDSKKLLINHWRDMATETRPLMSSKGGELELRLPAWLSFPVFVGLLLALSSLLTYFVGGFHAGSTQWPALAANRSAPAEPVPSSNPGSGHPGDGSNMEERLAALESRLKNSPEDLNGWVLLARTHASLSNYSKSADALAQALRLAPGHPDILADLADMLAMANGRVLAGQPMVHVQQALQSDPNHEKALALAASAAEQAGNAAQAQQYWQRLSAVQQAKLITPAQQEAGPPAIASATVTVLAQHRDTLNPGSAMFVQIKAQPGPGMPLAVVRIPADQLVVGPQTVQFQERDFIQASGASDLPATLYMQARLSVQGVAQAGQGDINSDWVKVQRAQLNSPVLIEFSK
ncbi:tetratricopeptide repeat protein [Limnobacter sp.]|uniref:tetratricopeptide repeat protein n=1 Tax=Limnobacter sp. TaxID=2003368 RepID=UPI003517EA32